MLLDVGDGDEHDVRAGDGLGAAGDGWSNLVHLDDVCMAAIRSLQLPLAPGESRVYNLAGPDAPRWNEYFVDLALEIGATPVRRISPLQLKLDAKMAGPALHVVRKLLQRAGRDPSAVPELQRLAELLGVPVMDSGASYLNMPNSHPLFGTGPATREVDVALVLDCVRPWSPDPANSPPAHAKIASHRIFNGSTKKMYITKSGFRYANARKIEPPRNRLLAGMAGVTNATPTVRR